MKDDNGLFYIRTWMKGSEAPTETTFTNIDAAEKFMNECAADRAYVRIEFLEAREWMTRSVRKAPTARSIIGVNMRPIRPAE